LIIMVAQKHTLAIGLVAKKLSNQYPNFSDEPASGWEQGGKRSRGSQPGSLAKRITVVMKLTLFGIFSSAGSTIGA